MTKIALLDEFTANQIAAGEVVERPVSVVKELVENSLDADATKIIIELQQGGLSSIKVVDNGSGMTAEDAELCFQRHATSKIRMADDLNKILTLGFRGEAMPSIASVAKVTLITRTDQDLAGTRIQIEAGAIQENTPIGCPVGTTVEVKDLFYNTPARRKFLKSATTETGHVSDLISRLAMARPDVRFELRSGNKLLFQSPGNGVIRDTAAVILGSDNVKSMLEIDYQGELIQLRGLVSKPVLTRASRQYQNIFINGRYIRSALISLVLQQAYQTLIPQGRFPIAILHLTIDPTQVDVNVHPTKMEVRIAREQEIQRELLDAIGREINSSSAITGLWEFLPGKQVSEPKSEIEVAPSSPKNAKGNNQNHSGLVEPAQSKPENRDNGLDTFNKRDQLKFSMSSYQEQRSNDSSELIPSRDNQVRTQDRSTRQILEQTGFYEPQRYFPDLAPLGHFPPTYVLASGEEGLYVIDQHAAHERVLYEKYLNQLKQNVQSQMLLHPFTLEIPHHEAQLIIRFIVEFSEIGYILEHFGGDTFIIRGVPSIAQDEPREIFLDLLARIQESRSSHLERNLVIDQLAAAMSCRDAVKAGKHFGHPEIKALLEGLAHCKQPYTCPHGRPTLIQISQEELKKRFKR